MTNNRKEFITVNTIMSGLAAICFAFFSWEGAKVVNSVDNLTQMVYLQQGIIQEHEKRIDRIEGHADLIIPTPKDGTNLKIFN